MDAGSPSIFPVERCKGIEGLALEPSSRLTDFKKGPQKSSIFVFRNRGRGDFQFTQPCIELLIEPASFLVARSTIPPHPTNRAEAAQAVL